MLLLCVLALFGQTFTWLAPAPLLAAIIPELRINLGQAGSLLTVITLAVGIFAFWGSLFVDKFGAKLTMIASLVIVGLGGLLSLLADRYSMIYIARFVVGLGFGISIPIGAMVVTAWFPSKEQPYINSILSIVCYVGMSLAYLLTLPILKAVGTWQNTLASFGAYVIVVALLWGVFAKTRTAKELPDAARRSAEINVKLNKKGSGLAQAGKRREVLLLAVMMIGVMWTFNTFTTYLPLYFQQVHGLEATMASAATGILPLAGIFGGVACGFGTGMLGLRKPFTWPLFLLMMLGVVLSIFIPFGPFLYLGVGLIGFGAAGFCPIVLQVPMELENITPELVGGASAIIIGSSYIVSYFSPMAFGLLAPKLGAAKALFILGCSMAISIVAGLMIRETGPRFRAGSPHSSRTGLIVRPNGADHQRGKDPPRQM